MPTEVTVSALRVLIAPGTLVRFMAIYGMLIDDNSIDLTTLQLDT